jgi:hypothetical protein
MDKVQQSQLRAPFPPERIQKLDAGYAKLDYVSHAWVTDRLLEVDPEWTWEPAGFDANGLPAFDENGGLWIKLTVGGVTRFGYGEPQGRDNYDRVKGAIGNALRNAAMRFGVALDLWAKEVAEQVSKTKTQEPISTGTEFLKLKEQVGNCNSLLELAQVAIKITEAKLTDKEKDALRFAWSQRKEQVS